MKFGQRLKTARQQKGLTQEAVARELGVTRQSVYNWENDRSYPDLASATRMSRLYGMSLDELLQEDEGLHKEMEQRRQKLRKYSSWLFDGALLFLVLSLTLVRFELPGWAVSVGVAGIGLFAASNVLLAWKMGGDPRWLGLRVLSIFLWYAGALVSRWDALGLERPGRLLILVGIGLNLTASYHLEKEKQLYRRNTAFTGFVLALVLVIPWLPSLEHAMERGTFQTATPFTGADYRVSQVLEGADSPLPRVNLSGGNRLYLDYPGEDSTSIGKPFTYVSQPEGAGTLGVWEMIPEGSHALYRVEVDKEEAVTLEYWESEVLQWKYRLERAPVMGVTIQDVLGLIMGSAAWRPLGETDPKEVGSLPLRGKGTVKLSLGNGEDTLTIYLDGEERVLPKNEKGQAELELDAQGQHKTVRIQIPHDGGEFLLDLKMTP